MGEGAGEVTEADRYSADALEARSAADDDNLDDPAVDDLVGGIEGTREEMTLTVEEIGDRLDPKNIVDDAKETVRAATVGKVEVMASTAGAMVGDASETVRDAGTGLMDTITRNPIPAALVGIGLGWLALSGRSNGGSRRQPYDYRLAADDGTGRWSDQLGQRRGTENVQQKAGAMVDRMGRTVGQKADDVSQVAEQVPYQVQSVARDMGSTAGRMFQQAPLAVGAIAVAVGAAVGLVLPATEAERRTIGEPARQALQKAEGAASEALDQVEQTARDAEQQAREEDRVARPH